MRGHLDYGIDGPLTGDVGLNVELNLGTEETADGTVVSMVAAPDPNASLPYFMQQAGSTGAGTSQVWTSFLEHGFPKLILADLQWASCAQVSC